MIKEAKESWQQFTESEPGRRFKDRYRRRRRAGRRHFLWKVFNVILGSVIAVGSLVLAPLPGPGWGTVVIGLMILAGEVEVAARFLDWAEVKLRKLARRAGRLWNRASNAIRAAIVAATLSCIAALGYGAYYLTFGG